MNKIYLDNASTTPLRPEVIDEMTKVMTQNYGNPSSTHSTGRFSKSLVELSRKSIATHFKILSNEIIFTSSGTEANNWIIKAAIVDLKLKRIITSKIEHHSVLNPIHYIQKSEGTKIDFVKILPNGNIDLQHLQALLSENIPTLVSLMHVNNEIGTILDIAFVSKICKQHNAFFHTDAVQSTGKTIIDLEKIKIDFLVGSAHKFHGPKGIGFAFIRNNIVLNPLILGGDQEKGLRAGTESIHNIVGMAKALEISLQNLEAETRYISELKNYCSSQLKNIFKKTLTIGENCFYNILNISLPFAEEKANLLLFKLDLEGIAVSRGSACQSGSNKPSHVLAEIVCGEDLKKPNIRISFSHYNTKKDIDFLINALKSI